jgi:putative autotransporter adhesin-like protein
MSAAPTPLRRRTIRRPTWLLWLLAGIVLGAGIALAVSADHSREIPRGSGVVAEQARHVPPFRGLDLAGSNIVAVRVGGRRSVVVRGDDNLLAKVTTTVRSGRLVIDTLGSFSTRAPMRVLVTTPSLDRLALSGSGIVTAAGVRAKTFAVTLAGSGVLRAGGSADRLVATLSGSGLADLGGLVAREARAVAAGSGRIDVTVTRTLRASVPGTGAIFYGGDPDHVSTSVSGTGAIVPTS